MRRTVALILIAGLALGLALLGDGTADPAQARSSVENSSLRLAAPAQPVPPFEPPDPAAPVRAGTPGTDLADVPLQRLEPAQTPESVILPDGRQYIGAWNNLLAPWKWVAYLEVTGQPGSYCEGGCRCSGFLIGYATVVTAGHCVYDSGPQGLGGWAVDVRVAPGKDGVAEPFGAQMATELWSVNGWVVDGDAEYDYGAVILDHAFAGLGGPFFPYADIAAGGMAPRLTGYPGDISGFQQYYDDDSITNVAARIVSYEIDTAGGQSGSPVWYPPSGPTRQVLAVHTRGVGDATCNPTDNCGTRVESTVIANFDYWLSLGLPVAVGGIAERPELAEAPAAQSASPVGTYAALAGGLAAALAALSAGAWYAKRRWLR